MTASPVDQKPSATIAKESLSDYGDPVSYRRYLREGQEFTDRINTETAEWCTNLVLHGPLSNQTDPARVVQLVLETLCLDVLNLKWGGRREFLALLRQQTLAAMPKKERRG